MRARFMQSYVSLVAAAVVLSACAATGGNDDKYRIEVYRSGDNYVRLEPIESGAPANAHPFVISADSLGELLSRIKVSGSASRSSAPVFSKEELDKIAAPLASALSESTSKQDVVFAVTGHHGIFGEYSPVSLTTGRLFVNGDSVNLIFGLMQERLDRGSLDYSGAAPRIVPGTRAHRVDEAVWRIDPGIGRFHERRGDWLAFDRSAVPAAPAAGGASTPSVDSREQDIENRLRLLDRLREKGVITEPEYHERRREILQEL